MKPIVAMNTLVTITQKQSHWLCLIAATIVGMFCASTVGGQDTYLINDPLRAPSVELDGHSIAPPAQPEVQFDFDYEPRDQFVLTRERRPRKRCVCVKAKDQVWFVSARQAHTCPDQISHLKSSLLQDNQWNPRNLDDLTNAHATDDRYVTFVYVHGNRTNEVWAKSRGLQVYQSLFSKCHDECRPPIRFVIYCWKSEQEKLLLRPDYKIKSQRAPVVGQNFGLFLNQFQDRKMVVCGFSLGSQVVLAGLSRNQKIPSSQQDSRYKVALMAPALDPDFVCPALYGLTCNSLIERTEVFYSESDRAIRAAEKIARKSCREWISVFQQLSMAVNPVNPVKIIDVTSAVEKRHSTVTYVESPQVQAALKKMVFELEAAKTITCSTCSGSLLEFKPKSVTETVDGEFQILVPQSDPDLVAPMTE